MAYRLDESAWRPAHTRIAGALAVGWMRDAFEVQIIGSVIPSIASEFDLSEPRADRCVRGLVRRGHARRALVRLARRPCGAPTAVRRDARPVLDRGLHCGRAELRGLSSAHASGAGGG